MLADAHLLVKHDRSVPIAVKGNTDSSGTLGGDTAAAAAAAAVTPLLLLLLPSVLQLPVDVAAAAAAA
jgi:hypothetical protein